MRHGAGFTLAVAAALLLIQPLTIATSAGGTAAERLAWRAGDIVFRNGTGIEAAVVRQVDDSGFTHVGMLAGAYPNWTVIHAEPEDKGRGGKVEEISLEAFAAHATSIAVFRVASADSGQSGEALSRARAYIGLPFDDDYRYSDDDGLYCTELVLKSYAGKVEVDWERDAVTPVLLDEPVITPAALIKSGVLRRVGA